MDRLGNYYRLFMNKISFVPIPISAFRSEEDRKRFEELFHDKMPSKTALLKQVVIFLLVSVLLLGSAYAVRIPTAPSEDNVRYFENREESKP